MMQNYIILVLLSIGCQMLYNPGRAGACRPAGRIICGYVDVFPEVSSMAESIRVSTVVSVPPERVYRAWLDGDEHGHFTGSPAEIAPRAGGAFKAWDGYIEGTTLELEPFHRIVQAWRTTDFPDGAPDSRLEVLLKEVKDGTEITLVHTNIPDGQGKGYEQGWIDYYFTPMAEYFAPEETW
jgi:uncharacterized protein YndB with AHSA1/START domain